MSITVRSFLLIAAYVAVIAGQYFVANAVGHQVTFVTYPNIVPESGFFEHAAVRLLLAMLSLGFLFGLLMGNPRLPGTRMRLFDAERSTRYRICLAMAGVIYLIIFFALSMLPNHTAYGVLMVDLILFIGIIMRIVSWNDSRTRSLSETS